MQRMHRALALLLCLCLLPLCGAGAAGTVTDASGAILTIPAEGETVTIVSVYAVAVPFLAALGLEKQVVAVNCKSRFWTDNMPALA